MFRRHAFGIKVRTFKTLLQVERMDELEILR